MTESILEILTMIVAGCLGLGILLVIRLIRRRPLRWWAYPLVVGLAVVAETILWDYTWGPERLVLIPEDFEIASYDTTRVVSHPWSLAVPFIDRITAVDRRLTGDGALRQGNVLNYSRWVPTTVSERLFDCPGGRMAAHVDGVLIDAQGQVTGAEWSDVAPGDPVFELFCGATAPNAAPAN